MADRAFTEKGKPPDVAGLTEVLGASWPRWMDIREGLHKEFGRLTEEWKFYNGSGWTLKTFLKKRNLFFMIPHHGSFRLAFVFGDKAVAAVERSALPRPLVESLVSARKYAEGRGLTLEVVSPGDVVAALELARIKAAS